MPRTRPDLPKSHNVSLAQGAGLRPRSAGGRGRPQRFVWLGMGVSLLGWNALLALDWGLWERRERDLTTFLVPLLQVCLLLALAAVAAGQDGCPEGFSGPLCGTCHTDAACVSAFGDPTAGCDRTFSYNDTSIMKSYDCTVAGTELEGLISSFTMACQTEIASCQVSFALARDPTYPIVCTAIGCDFGDSIQCQQTGCKCSSGCPQIEGADVAYLLSNVRCGGGEEGVGEVAGGDKQGTSRGLAGPQPQLQPKPLTTAAAASSPLPAPAASQGGAAAAGRTDAQAPAVLTAAAPAGCCFARAGARPPSTATPPPTCATSPSRASTPSRSAPTARSESAWAPLRSQWRRRRRSRRRRRPPPPPRPEPPSPGSDAAGRGAGEPCSLCSFLWLDQLAGGGFSLTAVWAPGSVLVTLVHTPFGTTSQ